METTEDLKLGISEQDDLGDKLQPKPVTVKEVTIDAVGEKGAKKVVLHCIHPDAPDSINISEVKIERTGKLEVVGLWVNKNKMDGKLRKNSGLAMFLRFLNCNTIEELQHKTIQTIQTEKGYLALKGY